MSLCIGRLKLSDEQVLARIKRLVDKRKPYTTIIQADGDPMSGGEDDYATTLPAVMMAKIVQSANLPIYLLLSGGTNSKTAELARQHCVDFNGIAIGSYARKINRMSWGFYFVGLKNLTYFSLFPLSFCLVTHLTAKFRNGNIFGLRNWGEIWIVTNYEFKF